MKKIKLTIIVPVYNGENYIEAICMQLNNQTYKDFDVIFIDDCSKDNSYQKLKEVEKKYDFIKVIKNKENQGAGYSRNYAIKQTNSEYISFIDCDDEIPTNYFEELVKAITSEKADMALCDVKITYDMGFGEVPDFYNNTCHKIPVEKSDIIHNDIAAAAWNKIIKRELILKNPFSEGIINEDIPAIIGSILDAKKIAYTNKTFYTYIQRKSSVQNGTKIQKKFDVFQAVDELIKRKSNNKILKDNIDAIVYHQLILFLFFGIIAVENDHERSRHLKQFEESCKKYNYRQNKYYWSFIDSQRRKIKYYYKIILKLMKLHLFHCASFIISLGNWYSKVQKSLKKSMIKHDITLDDLIFMAKKNQKRKLRATISVVIPNYNYANFLYQRIYSILYQQEKISEIIILDDCSKDNSREVIDEVYQKLSPFISIQKVYNKNNSGSPFKQWEKGFSLAKSDYVWIAEADDYSSSKFLNQVIEPMIEDKEIVLSYCDTSYIHTNGITLTKTVKDLIDIMETGHWDQDYVNDGLDEIKNYEFLNCTIANVSSVIFKKDNYKSELQEAGTFKQCGDWYFYFSVMKKGKVAYCASSYNYCRLHGSNSTTNLKKKIHYEEIKRVQKIISDEFTVRKDAKKHIKSRLDYLKEVWDLTDID